MEQSMKDWIVALRSGEYKQAHGRLRAGDTYCCLGVACDLYSKSQEGEWNEDTFLLPVEHDNESGEFETDLPYDVQTWLGLDSDDEGKLVDMNDGSTRAGYGHEPQPFTSIANYLESKYDPASQ